MADLQKGWPLGNYLSSEYLCFLPYEKEKEKKNKDGNRKNKDDFSLTVLQESL